MFYDFIYLVKGFRMRPTLNLANKRRRKVIIRRVWLIRSTAITMNVTSANQLLHLSMTSRERVSFMDV